MKVLWVLCFLSLVGCASFSLHQVPDNSKVTLPEDHGPHDFAQTEWWHVHADLTDIANGEPLHLFAGFAMQRTDLDKGAFIPLRLIANPYHAGYVQLVDGDRSRVRARNGFPQVFSARFVGDGLDLRHGGWRIAWDQGALVLKVRAGKRLVDLKLEPTRPATLPGDEGRTEIVPGTRHMWMQMEGMHVQGRWQEGNRVRWVEGMGFFKHQWGRLLVDDVDGFEWISVDLPDGRALVMIWVHQGGQMGVLPGSQAWIAEGGGAPRPLAIEDMKLSRERFWRSPRNGTEWPVAWTIRGGGIDLRVETMVDDQELPVIPAPFYAGPARARGTVEGVAIDAPAFVEHVGGYVPPLRPLFDSQAPPDAEEVESE